MVDKASSFSLSAFCAYYMVFLPYLCFSPSVNCGEQRRQSRLLLTKSSFHQKALLCGEKQRDFPDVSFSVHRCCSDLKTLFHMELIPLQRCCYAPKLKHYIRAGYELYHWCWITARANKALKIKPILIFVWKGPCTICFFVPGYALRSHMVLNKSFLWACLRICTRDN